ncbi:hypothetical protein [Thalassobacillus sp. B23F22_16]|uniref:hypothetical protein n=1 Tax=Thalassobacillus sp. B23F22_16 TaxID=3459513 RepID=UPI00373F3583
MGLLKVDEAVTALEMVNVQHLTVHTYDEEIAVKIHNSLHMYYRLLQEWMMRIRGNIVI